MPELQPGDPRRLGSYELIERLGEGGQGVVYLGQDASGARVAVKLLRADLTEDAMARSRFVREVQAAKMVARFCTAQVLEADVAGDQPYIASEYVLGRSLQAAVAQDGPLTGAGLERLAIGTATALVAIHQADIVHRDFKPHNVLMAPDGPRVIDFGIARALDATSTTSTKAIGTPAYMAPEQVAGQALTPAVDIFAWAATIVFAATANPPFGQDTIPAVLQRLLHDPPALDDLPDQFRALITQCLAKDPAQRPSAQDVLMRLIGGSTGAGAGMPMPGVPAPTSVEGTRVEPAQAGDTGELPTTVLAQGVQRAGPTDGHTMVAGQGDARTRAAGAGETLPPVRYAEPYGRGRPPGRRSKGPIIGAVAAVAAVLLLIGGLVWAMGGDDKPDSTPSSTPASEPTTSAEPSDTDTGGDTNTSEPDDNEPSTRPTTSPTQTGTGTSTPTRPRPTTSSGGGGSGSPGGGSGGGTGGSTGGSGGGSDDNEGGAGSGTSAE